MSDVRVKEADEKFCSSCGSIILEKAEICPKCGVRQAGFIPTGAVSVSGEKSRLIALLLAFLFGQIGVHRMYVGKIGTGLLMAFLVIMGLIILLLFGLAGLVEISLIGLGFIFIWTIWIIIDVFMIALGKFKDKKGNYITRW